MTAEEWYKLYKSWINHLRAHDVEHDLIIMERSIIASCFYPMELKGNNDNVR